VSDVESEARSVAVATTAVQRRDRLGGLIDDLVDPLVAQPQHLGDLPQRPTRRVQPADRVVIVRPGLLGGMLRGDQPLPCGLGVAHQFRIKTHVSSY
jgi:hypothetical protein